MRYGAGVDELVLEMRQFPPVLPLDTCATRTGTFFCEMTTAQSFPRTPSDVMFAAVMALNAYSSVGKSVLVRGVAGGRCGGGRGIG